MQTLKEQILEGAKVCVCVCVCVRACVCVGGYDISERDLCKRRVREKNWGKIWSVGGEGGSVRVVKNNYTAFLEHTFYQLFSPHPSPIMELTDLVRKGNESGFQVESLKHGTLEELSRRW